MLKVLELFAGYGSQALALENLGLDFTSDISEIDKYAIDAYNQIHGQTKNYGDICGIDEAELPEYDLVTYSSPCQDFSLAGKQRGGEKGSGTRSSLLWECERIIRAVKPKYLLMENVKNLVGKKFMPCFKAWLRTLEELGYNNYWKVLNAKDYGVPQNRERVFVVSIRKDLNQTYTFPEPVPLKTRLKDLLEPEVEESFYLPQEKVEQLALNLNKDVSNAIRVGGRGTLDGKHTWDVVIAASRGRNPENPSSREAGLPTVQMLEINESGYSNTLTTVGKDNLVVEPNVLTPKRTEYGKAIRKEYEAGNIQESRHNMTELKQRTDGVSNTLTTVQKDNLLYIPINTCSDGSCQALPAYLHKETANDCTKFERHSPATGVLVIKANTKKGYEIESVGDSINLAFPKSENRRGRVGYGVAQTLQTTNEQVVLANNCPKCSCDGVRIRKLTPRECWRLMGVKDEQFDCLHGISNTQLYKMAGNSIVVDVLMAIFKNLLISDKETKGQLSLF